MDLFIMNLFGSSEEKFLFFSVLIIVVFSICLHEYFHAQAAYWLGDRTAADAGHLTLNPFKQMGVVSLLMFLFFGVAWGSVPVQPKALKYKWGRLAVSFAGPFANLLLFSIAWILFLLLPLYISIVPEFLLGPIIHIIGLFGIYNGVLFMLNMIPAPMLDGWNVFSYFFPKMADVNSEFAKGFFVFVLFVVFFGIKYLFFASQFLMERALIISRLIFHT